MLQWNSWSKEAFNKAKKDKKPILLNISASWCHTCHTMDELTYGDENISKLISEKFTPVRVDTDKRPDVNERYNVGGFPSTLVLAFDGEVVSGATYVPPQAMSSFLEDALERLKKYKSKKKQLLAKRQVPFNDDEFFEIVKGFYDPVNRGFGLEPKFLHPDILEYLLSRDDSQSKKMLEETLLRILDSEVFDSVGGGFFRYASQRNWTFPHFEKLLEDNAKMLGICIKAYNKFKRREFLTAISKIIFFLTNLLYGEQKGVFYSSQAADENYCSLTSEERNKVELPFIDKTIYIDANAVAAKAFLREKKEIALKTLEFLWKSLRGGVPHEPNSNLYFLKDAVCLLDAFVAAFHFTNRLEWKSRAETVAKHLERFYDKKEGGFFDTLLSKDAVARLKERKKPVNENALASIALFELSKMTKNDKYKVMAEKSLQAVSADAHVLGVYGAGYALAYRLILPK